MNGPVRRFAEEDLTDEELRLRRLREGLTYFGWAIKDLSEVDYEGAAGVVRQLGSCRNWLKDLLEEKEKKWLANKAGS